MNGKKILVVAAHPDDAYLGMGGTIARLKAEGHEVQMMIYGKGRGDKLDQRFDTIPLLEITQEIEARISSYKPEVIYTHDGQDLNNDHRLIYEATLVATRPLPGFCVKELYSYEIVSSSEWRCSQGIEANVWVDIKPYFAEKLQQLEDLYDDEMRPWPHPRSYEGVETLAKYRGMQVGVEYAEAFKAVRIIKF